MNASVCLPKWKIELPCYSFDFGLRDRMIHAIFVDSPTLSSSYFKEYLGFRIIFRRGRGSKSYVLLFKQGNWILLKSNSLESSKEHMTEKKQTVKIVSKNIATDYLALRGKVRIVKYLHHVNNKIKTFVITDCNGIDIVYVSKA